MGDFLTLAGQLFVILCIHSVLEVMAAARWHNYLQKPIELGCYGASLILVLRFLSEYFAEIMGMFNKMF